MVKKVCIIGAGSAGLCVLREVIDENNSASSDSPTFEVTVYEKNEEVGGLWSFADASGTIGGPGVLFKNLRTNTPKVAWGFKDCPVMEDVPNWMSPNAVKEQMIRFADKFNLKQFIKFNHGVEKVSKNTNVEAKTVWDVRVKNNTTGEVHETTYDYVIVCSGVNNSTNHPQFPGETEFPGTIIHSSDYRLPEAYKDKKVLIVGTRVTMFEICHDIQRYAKEILISGEGDPLFQMMRPTPPDNARDVSALETFENGFAVLKDGSKEEVDDVILCTGYSGHYTFPFLDSSCLVGSKYKHLYPAYKNMFHPDHPSLIFHGFWDVSAHVPLCEAMATFIRKVITEVISLPDKDEMYKSIERDYDDFLKSGMPGKLYFCIGPERQFQYIEWLCKEGNFSVPKYPFVVFDHLIKRLFNKQYYEIRKENYIKIDDQHFEIRYDD